MKLLTGSLVTFVLGEGGCHGFWLTAASQPMNNLNSQRKSQAAYNT